MDINEVGSYASIFGIIITLIGATITVFTYFKVSNLKKEFLLVSSGEKYAQLFDETNTQLSEFLDSYNSFDDKDNRQKIKECFKGIEGSLHIVKSFVPSSHRSVKRDISKILKLINNFPDYGNSNEFSKYKEGKASLVNIVKTLPKVVEHNQYIQN